jgi:hypothetical protein
MIAEEDAEGAATGNRFNFENELVDRHFVAVEPIEPVEARGAARSGGGLRRKLQWNPFGIRDRQGGGFHRKGGVVQR